MPANLLSSRAFWLLLPLLWAVVFLPALSARPLRLEEGRRATPAREMLQTGRLLQPTLYGEPYLNKPPLFFWLIAGLAAPFGGDAALWRHPELFTRLPSVLSLLAGCYVLLLFAPRQIPRPTRALAALFLLSTVAILDKGTLGEIESFLALLVFAAAAVWYRGYEPGKPQCPYSWLLTGLLLAAAMLTKGPPAIAQFYVPLIVFLAWQRDLKRLFSFGHLACIVLFVAPMLAWVYAIRVTDPAAFNATVANWLHQMGLSKAAVADTHGHISAGELLVRYLKFPFEVAVMLLPWLPLAIVALIPSLSPQSTTTEAAALRRYLACLLIAAFVFFWLWPSARPRHMIAVCYPAALLAALGATALAHLPARRRLAPALIPLVATIILLAAGAGLTVFAYRKARTDQPRVVAATILPHLPPRQSAYTLVTFLSHKSDLVPDLYNIQFYLARRLVALPSLDQLPVDTPATVLMFTRDLTAAGARPDLSVRPLAQTPLRNNPTDQQLWAVEVLRTPARGLSAGHL